jgi:hypothetical protein
VEIALLKSGLSSMAGASALAPSFISWIARTNRNSAAANVASLSATRIAFDPDPAGAVARSGAAVASTTDVPAVGVGSSAMARSVCVVPRLPFERREGRNPTRRPREATTNVRPGGQARVVPEGRTTNTEHGARWAT